MKTQKKTKTRWGWVGGKVNTSHEHFEIAYGSVGRDDPDTFPLVALVASGRGRQYIVEFVAVGLSGPEKHEIRKQVVEEIEFYLIRYRPPGRSRWAYAVYHCGTAANLYSKVHWAYFPKGANTNVSPGNRS